MKPLFRRERADRDIQEALDFYSGVSREQALAFVGALEQACRRLQRRPGAGSPRYALTLNLPGLRCARWGRFPFLIFYMERESSIEIWRVLHTRRDIPAWLAEE